MLSPNNPVSGPLTNAAFSAMTWKTSNDYPEIISPGSSKFVTPVIALEFCASPIIKRITKVTTIPVAKPPKKIPAFFMIV